MHFDLPTLIKTFGYPLVWAIVFAESGLLFGFLLPGDSLLFVAGFLCSLPQAHLDIRVMAFGCFVFAVLGDNVGYYTGHKYGRKLFSKPDSRFFKKKHLVAAQDFFEQKGQIAIVIARFMPFIRTFAPIIAGIASMKYKTFMTYNLLGGLLWAVGLTLLGYFLGKTIPEDKVDEYLIPITLLIMFVSLAPSVFHMWKESQKK